MQKLAGRIELECGSYQPTGTQFMVGVYRPKWSILLPNPESLRCDEPTAKLVDAALAHAAEDLSVAMSDHMNARRLLIQSGSAFALGAVEPRFTNADSSFIGAIYRREPKGQRPWSIVAMASSWKLAALAALLLHGEASNGEAIAPPAGLVQFGISLILGTPPHSNLNGFAVSADSETLFKAEAFPETLLVKTTVLARRIPSSEERADQLEEVA
jgi:hypothetical protein